MKIILAGATGFIGSSLICDLIKDGHELVLLTRDAVRARQRFGDAAVCELWDGQRAGEWSSHLDGADAVVNLAGTSIAGRRWNARHKAAIRDSRILATRAIVESMRRAANRPSLLINASAVGYYGNVPDGTVDESAPASPDFLGRVCLEWETEAMKAEELGVKVARIRMGIVLGVGGGALEKMVLPFRLFVGGPLGSGSQWFPWVHRDDVVGVIRFVLSRGIGGPFNVTAPNPVTMNEFCRALGRALYRPCWLSVPAFVLRLAVGEMAGNLLGGQRAIPSRLLHQGYAFKYRELEAALRDLL
jgi:hypothetical protein